MFRGLVKVDIRDPLLARPERSDVFVGVTPDDRDAVFAKFFVNDLLVGGRIPGTSLVVRHLPPLGTWRLAMIAFCGDHKVKCCLPCLCDSIRFESGTFDSLFVLSQLQNEVGFDAG